MSRPAFYEGNSPNTPRMYKGNPPWGLEGSLENFSKSQVLLVNGKINKENRLSSSEESTGTIIKRSSLWEAELNEQIYDNWISVLNKIDSEPFNYITSDENQNLLILKISNWGAGCYDNIAQVYTHPIYDAAGREIKVKVKYSERNKKLVEKLESLAAAKELPEMVLGKIFVGDGGLSVFPFTGYYVDGRIVNLILD